jgi:hypothetical protein
LLLAPTRRIFPFQEATQPPTQPPPQFHGNDDWSTEATPDFDTISCPKRVSILDDDISVANYDQPKDNGSIIADLYGDVDEEKGLSNDIPHREGSDDNIEDTVNIPSCNILCLSSPPSQFLRE